MSRRGQYLNYDTFATHYDSTRAIPSACVDDIVKLCGRTARLAPGGYFLDAGVGTGRFGAPMAGIYPNQIVGIDVSTEMLHRAQEKAGLSLCLLRGDLQRLPFPDGVFQGALIVHILHLVERWQDVLQELRRVLVPGGVLLLGGEQGGKSVLVNYYLQQARLRGISISNLGVPGTTLPLAFLRRTTAAGIVPRIELVSGQGLTWKREAPVRETLATLESRVYSQMRNVSEGAHVKLLADTRSYAVKTIGSLDAVETLETRFVLYGIWNR